MKRSSRHFLARAFTMLELTLVIIVVGILAGAFLGPSADLVLDMQRAGAAAELERALLSARARAVAEGRPVGVYVTGTSVNPSFSTLASAAGIAAVTHAAYTLELSSITSGTARISTSVADTITAPATCSLPSRFGGVQVTSITNGSMSGTAIWFAADGSPELRDLDGTYNGLRTTDLSVQLTGGGLVSIRAGSGLVEMQ